MMSIAVAGAGMVSVHHLRAWQACGGAHVVAIADTDVSRAERRRAEFGVPMAYDDVATMLDRERPDVLDIAAGHGAHAALCSAAADRGIAILCQKPLAPTLAAAREIVAAVAGRVPLMVHENWRFRPWYALAARWLVEGAIGRPTSLSLATVSSGFIERDGARPALQRQPMLGVVPRLMIGEILVHHLDVAVYLIGALAVRAATVRHGVVGICGETSANIELAGAGTTAIVSGDLLEPDAPLVPADTLRIDGEQGTLVLEGGRLRVTGERSLAALFDLAAGYQASYDATIDHFVKALASGSPFATPPAVHMAVLAIVEDAYRVATIEN